jgi:hypothetical protein
MTDLEPDGRITWLQRGKQLRNMPEATRDYVLVLFRAHLWRRYDAVRAPSPGSSRMAIGSRFRLFMPLVFDDSIPEMSYKRANALRA